MHTSEKTPPPIEEFGPFDTNSNEGSCVTVAKGLPGTSAEGWRAIRDSKDPDGGIQFYDPQEWATFKAGVISGFYD